MENISKHITYSEAVKSASGIRLGIKNVPTEKELSRMRVLAEKVFEPLREKLGVPIPLVSFYRSTALNKAVGGASNSQHLAGATTNRNEAAMDIDADSSNTTNNEVFKYIKDNIVFDQLIAEFENEEGNGPAWIHVSYSDRNRNQILIAQKIKGKTVYSAYTKELYKKIYG